MKYVKLFEQFVAEQEAICEATVMMDALDPHSRDLKKLLKKHNVQMEIGVSGGPGASMGAGTEVTLTGKRSDLEKVLADPMGWDDPDLAEYIEESKSINEAVLKTGRDEALANAIIAYFYAVDGTPEGDELISMRLNPVRSDIGTSELHKIVGWGKNAIKALSGAARVPGDFILPNVISVASGKEFYFADNDLVGPDGKNLIMGLNKMSFRDFVDELVKQGVISAPKY